MTRTPIWQAIATRLRDEIADGIHRPGDKLPTEAALATRFGVNRHTVRQALAALAAEALVRPRRGAGVLVTATPTDYPIGARVRFHQNLRAAGRSPAKQVLALETRAPSPAERDALGLTEGHVHVYEGLSLADGQVIALFRSVFPAARFPARWSSLWQRIRSSSRSPIPIPRSRRRRFAPCAAMRSSPPGGRTIPTRSIMC